MNDSHIRIAARGVVVRDNAILLVEYRDYDGSNLHYNVPGGGVEYGETLQQAVQREVFEETCVTAQVHNLLFVYEHITAEDKHSLNFFFRASIADDAVPCMPAKLDTYTGGRQSAVVWIPLDEFADALIISTCKPAHFRVVNQPYTKDYH